MTGSLFPEPREYQTITATSAPDRRRPSGSTTSTWIDERTLIRGRFRGSGTGRTLRDLSGRDRLASLLAWIARAWGILLGMAEYPITPARVTSPAIKAAVGHEHQLGACHGFDDPFHECDRFGRNDPGQRTLAHSGLQRAADGDIRQPCAEQDRCRGRFRVSRLSGSVERKRRRGQAPRVNRTRSRSRAHANRLFTDPTGQPR